MELRLHHRVWRQISQRGLLYPGQRLLVAVSGGADSMVLLQVLHRLAQEEEWKLTVAHLNHGLRGRSSDADERLVRKTARALKLPIVIGNAEVKSIALKGGLSIEMAARRARHDFFATTARRLKISTVALAHHTDDQLELFFLRLLRGAGTQGIAGMRWTNASPADNRVHLVRPLLAETKADLLQFASEHRIRYREDATNASRDIARNRVRHELLPLLTKKYQPALRQRVVQLMDIFRAESDFVGASAEEWARGKGPFVALDFDKLPVAVQRRILHSRLIKKALSGDFDLVERLRLNSDTHVSVSGRLISRTRAGEITEGAIETHSEFNGAKAFITLTDAPGRTEFAGAKFSWHFETQKGMRGLKSVTENEVFDADEVGTDVILRHWQPGDRFRPIGMDRAVKLQDLFVNQKVPREKRRMLVVATTANGDIFWVEGLRIADHFKLTSGTKRRLRWGWQRG